MNQPVSGPWCVFFLPAGSIPFSRLESVHSLGLRLTSFIWELGLERGWTVVICCDSSRAKVDIQTSKYRRSIGLQMILFVLYTWFMSPKTRVQGNLPLFQEWNKSPCMDNIYIFILIYGICNVTIADYNQKRLKETSTIITSTWDPIFALKNVQLCIGAKAA